LASLRSREISSRCSTKVPGEVLNNQWRKSVAFVEDNIVVRVGRHHCLMIVLVKRTIIHQNGVAVSIQ
jgi:hypothetical protein